MDYRSEKHGLLLLNLSSRAQFELATPEEIATQRKRAPLNARIILTIIFSVLIFFGRLLHRRNSEGYPLPTYPAYPLEVDDIESAIVLSIILAPVTAWLITRDMK